MVSAKRLPHLMLAVMLGLMVQTSAHAMEGESKDGGYSFERNKGSEYTNIILFPLIKAEISAYPDKTPRILHLEMLEIPFIELMDVNTQQDSTKESAQGALNLLPVAKSGDPIVIGRTDIPLFSLLDVTVVGMRDRPHAYIKVIDSPIFTLWSEERVGRDADPLNRQWEAFDLPLITTLASKTSPDSTSHQFLNTPIVDVYKSSTCGKDSEMAILDVPVFSLYESATKDGKTRRSLLTSDWTVIDAPLFGVWSSEDTDHRWRDHRVLTLPLIGSLWSAETDGNDQVGRIFRIPIYKRSFRVDLKEASR